jgi:AcrR family transcriptional regulator
MVRWEPGTRERLQTAALDLYLREGFEQTTVAQIAASAGVTERTFFRHFGDKREVLFPGQGEFEHGFLDGIAKAPRGGSPLAMVGAALQSAAAFFPEDRHEWSRKRARVILANPALQEREQLKLSALASALAGALRLRGVQDPAAILAAQSGVTVFHVAFAQWLAEEERRPFAQIQQDVLRELTALTRAP